MKTLKYMDRKINYSSPTSSKIKLYKTVLKYSIHKI